tara:strand:- start:323 stop:631 length:309 start_codon:yes stop_codon:yes gene_type:complete
MALLPVNNTTKHRDIIVLSDIQRITLGLEILAKYKSSADVWGKPNSTWFLETQEEEYANITDTDRAELYQYGWRNRASSPYMWILATKNGLDIEKSEPEYFA